MLRILAGLQSSEARVIAAGTPDARFARTLFEQSLNRQPLRLSRDEARSMDALDHADVSTLTADDITQAARALGEGSGPDQGLSRWRRWWG